MGKSTGYWLASYGNMITDRPRMDAYLGEIAAALTARFPKLFARQQDVLTRAADLAERYNP